MKKVFKLLVIVFFIAFATTFNGCKKSAEISTLKTTDVSGITPISAVTGGNVIFSGGAEVTARGVCWGINNNPTIDIARTYDGIGTGTFSSIIFGLVPTTTYYVRAYATNKAGTAYGNEISFTSQAIVTTSEIVSFTSTNAVVEGSVFYEGSGGRSLIGSGICWSTSPNPTTANSKTINETFAGFFTSNLTGLTPGTAYFVRAYAVYDTGTDYGNELSFTTNI